MKCCICLALISLSLFGFEAGAEDDSVADSESLRLDLLRPAYLSSWLDFEAVAEDDSVAAPEVLAA